MTAYESVVPRMILVFGGCALAVTLAGGAQSESPTRSARDHSQSQNQAAPRQREGTSLVDVPGHFKLTGDRATFYPAGEEQRFGCLENLNLERVAQVTGENPELLEWVVSGTITEYHGTNYLLITKAILKNRPRGEGRARLEIPRSGGSQPERFSSR